MRQIKRVVPWAHKFAIRMFLAVATAIFALLTLVPTVNAQIAISITPPVCSYGYYGYAPYGCAPSGYYGPGYFYNGIFFGVGSWASWGIRPRLGAVIASLQVAEEPTVAATIMAVAMRPIVDTAVCSTC